MHGWELQIVSCGRLRWYGHLEQKGRDDWVSACRDYELVGQKSRGRGRKTWAECVKHDLQFLGLRATWADDRNERKNLINENRPTHASMEQETPLGVGKCKRSLACLPINQRRVFQ